VKRATPLIALLAVALFAPHSRAQANKRDAFGDYVKAARMLRDWRVDEARPLIAKLAQTYPKSAETKYLSAELAFLDGNYPNALARLQGLKDGDAHKNVGRLRRLATRTYAVTKGFAHKESKSGHFVIYYPPGKDEVIVELAGDVLEKAYSELGKDFGFYPKQKIRIEILTRPKDLAHVSTLTEKEIETTGTIALCKYNKLMVVTPRATLFGYAWMDTLVHEYVHFIVSTMSHDRVPVWLHEGLARFQQTRWRSGPTTKLSAIDEHLLASAVKGNRLIPFRKMHPSMAKLPSQEAATLAFAEVYTMVGYLHDKVGYKGLRKMIRIQRGGKSARRAVAEVMGRSFPRVERDWKRHLRASKLSTSRALAGRAKSRRIRFRKGSSKTENVGVEEVASKKARKYTRLGGLLRARGMSEAAAIEYEKALKYAPGDPFISAKLSRTYLELRKWKRAIALAKPLLDTDENDASPATTLGIAYTATNNPEEARKAFEIALRVSPFDPSVRCGLHKAYSSLGESALATREQRACAKLQQ
jgi:tetratricopeptide (TPR) repeat protein